MNAHTWVAALALSVAPVCTWASQEVPDDQEDIRLILVDQADSAMARAKYRDAAARLNEALAVAPEDPSNALLYANLGLAYALDGQDSLALVSVDRADELVPGSPRVLSLRARLFLKAGRDADAYRDFQSVIDADSLNQEARFYHGIMALYSGADSVAAADAGVLKAVAPDRRNTLVLEASYLSLKRLDAQAIPVYKRLIALDNAPEFMAALAGCQLAVEDLSGASETLAQGLESYPQDPELYYYRAWLNHLRFLDREAKEDANTAIRLGVSRRRAEEVLKRPR